MWCFQCVSCGDFTLSQLLNDKSKIKSENCIYVSNLVHTCVNTWIAKQLHRNIVSLLELKLLPAKVVIKSWHPGWGHSPVALADAELAAVWVAIIRQACGPDVGYRSADVPLSPEGGSALHLHSNRDVWVNRQQAPNLLLGLRGQDESAEMACSRHRRANSSGSVCSARKFPLRSDGKCFRSIRDKAAICIQFLHSLGWKRRWWQNCNVVVDVVVLLHNCAAAQ